MFTVYFVFDHNTIVACIELDPWDDASREAIIYAAKKMTVQQLGVGYDLLNSANAIDIEEG